MQTKMQQDQQMRDEVTDLRITVKKVVEPALKDILERVTLLTDARYLSEKDAREMYATKEDLQAIDTKYKERFKFWAKWAAAIISLLLGAIVSIAVAIFNKKIIGS